MTIHLQPYSRRHWSLYLVATVVLFGTTTVQAHPHGDDEHAFHDSKNHNSEFADETDGSSRPSDEHVWEQGYRRPDGEIVEGFWRNQSLSGYFWQEPGWDESGEWIDADFVPEESAPHGYVWVSGYRGSDGTWKLGFWRRESRNDHDWTGGYYSEGDYVAPHWSPREFDEDEYVYVPGYRATTGYWIPGFRRSRHRTGYAWITGYWDSGIWVSGFWRPTMSRTGYSYSPGHVGLDGYWVSGFWRRGARSGYMWVDGYYVGDSFVWGFWRPVRVRFGYTWIVGY
jgi:hypothetical protein